MKKYVIAACVLLVSVLCLQACSYNNKMYDHLSDPNNYNTYQVVLNKISYSDNQNNTREDIENVDFASAETVYLYVVFASREQLAPFLGVSPENILNPVDTYTVRLKICENNHKQLLQNGFYDAARAGDEIMVTASDWIYMDGEFFYVIEVEQDGTTYLDPTVGLQNVIDMMK